MIINGCAFLVSLLAAACNPTKTLYLSNSIKHPITLMVDDDVIIDDSSSAFIFKNALNGKYIVKHSVIHFGEGDWTEKDVESLKSVLAKTTVLMDGKEMHYRLPKKRAVAHYRLFVEELLVRFSNQTLEY